MVVVETETVINARAATIWAVVTDPSYMPKLYPDILTSVADSPGPATADQKLHLTGKVGRRRLDMFAKTTEVIKEKKLVMTSTVGGAIFKSYSSIILLEASGETTTVKSRFEYELNLEHLEKIFNTVALEQLVRDNLKGYSKNLKEISELLPVPE